MKKQAAFILFAISILFVYACTKAPNIVTPTTPVVTCPFSFNASYLKKWTNNYTRIDTYNSANLLQSSTTTLSVGYFALYTDSTYKLVNDGSILYGKWKINAACMLVLDDGSSNVRRFEVVNVNTDSLVIRRVDNNLIYTQHYKFVTETGPTVDSLKLGLIAYYPFNGNTNDETGNGHTGTAYNALLTTDRYGMENSAYYFNGFSSAIAVQDKQDLRLANTDFSLSAWVKIEAYNPSYGSLILSKRLPGYNNGWNLGIAGYAYSRPGILTYGPGGGSINAYGNKIVNLSQWHMVTGVYKPTTQQFSIYIDGALDVVNNNIVTPNQFISSVLYIGRDDPSSPTNGYFFQGTLDGIRVYNRALTSSQIKVLYNTSD
jgi:hypothetical protein